MPNCTENGLKATYSKFALVKLDACKILEEYMLWEENPNMLDSGF